MLFKSLCDLGRRCNATEKFKLVAVCICKLKVAYGLCLRPLTWVLILLEYSFGEVTVRNIPEFSVTGIEPPADMQQAGYWVLPDAY